MLQHGLGPDRPAAACRLEQRLFASLQPSADHYLAAVTFFTFALKVCVRAFMGVDVCIRVYVCIYIYIYNIYIYIYIGARYVFARLGRRLTLTLLVHCDSW